MEGRSRPGVVADEPSRSAKRDAEARAALEPLKPGERPRAVTAAVIVSVALALANLGAYAAGAKIGGERPAPLEIVSFTGVALMLAGAMWRSQYWAVLTMQAVLAIAMLVFAMLLMVARNIQAAALCVAVIAGAGTLFWFLVRAMGRIQATERSAPAEDQRR